MGLFSLSDLEYRFWNGLRNGTIGTVGAKGDPGGIVQTDLLSTDLNTLNNVSGAYNQPNSAIATTALGYPYANFIGSILILKRGPDRVTQFAYPQTGSLTVANYYYVRVNAAEGFSPWKVFSSTRVDQTAGRAIYQWDSLNNREQLIYGDTGSRDIAADTAWNDALFIAGSVDKTVANMVRIRRIGYECELNIALDKAGSGGVSASTAFPLGFRPASPLAQLGSNSSHIYIRAYHGGGTTPINWNSTGIASAVTIQIKYTTTDAWPTTLPGTPVGGIPNL